MEIFERRAVIYNSFKLSGSWPGPIWTRCILGPAGTIQFVVAIIIPARSGLLMQGPPNRDPRRCQEVRILEVLYWAHSHADIFIGRRTVCAVLCCSSSRFVSKCPIVAESEEYLVSWVARCDPMAPYRLVFNRHSHCQISAQTLAAIGSAF